MPPITSPLLLLATESTLTDPLPFAGGELVACSERRPGVTRDNQDAVALLPVGDTAGLLLVADGMGGGRSGDTAARIAAQTLAGTLAGVESTEAALRGATLDGIERANQAVLELGIGAATTLAAVAVVDDRARPVHVGDSDILLFGQRGRMHHQSVAHGPTGFAVEAGVLEPEAAMHHDERHLVSNMVGSREMRIEIGPMLRLAVRDTLLLASDGVTDNLYVAELVETCRRGSLADAGRALRDLVRRRMEAPGEGQPSKPDDFSFVLFRRRPPRPSRRRREPAQATAQPA